MMRAFGLAFLCATTAACSNDAAVTVINKAPTGIVGGMVLDGATDSPLAEVDVQVQSGGRIVATAKTAADGLFSVAGVPAGTFYVGFTKSGYVSIPQYQGRLDAAIGNFPIDNPSATLPALGLISSLGTFTVKVLDDSAKPVAGVQLTARPQIRYVEYVDGARQQRGNYTVLAMTDANGLAEITGLPDIVKLGTFTNNTDANQYEYYGYIDRLWIDVAPIKDPQSGVYLFKGVTTFFDLTRVAQQVPTITLAGPNDALSVLDSNIEYLNGLTATSSKNFSAQLGSVLAQTSPYYVLFNQALDTDVRAQITDEFGTIQPITLTAEVNGNLLKVTPMVTVMGPLPGKRYNLVLSVTALSSAGIQGAGKEFSATAPFWIQSMQPNVTVQAGVGALTMERTSSNEIIMSFTLSEAVGIGGGSILSLGCVAYYEDADFDGDDNKSVRGEYGSGSNMSCEAVAGAAINVSQITPVRSEDTNSPDTGYYASWKVTLDSTATNGPCATFTATFLDADCVRPKAGKKMYLIFSKSEATSTVRRPDGKPISNVIEITIPAFPPVP